METALPSRSSLASFAIVTAMMLAALWATPAPTTPFSPALAGLNARIEADLAVARLDQIERELARVRLQMIEIDLK